MKVRTRIRGLVCAVAMVTLLAAAICGAQQLAKRLILKDGSYQLASEWKLQGERVRYFSAERSEWEELPASMVDWPATDKYQKDRASGVPLPEAVEFDKKLAAERAAEEAKRPEVAPGLRLPSDGGVLLLDTFESQPQLVPVEGKVVQVNQKGHGEVDCMNFACSDPNVKDKVEIAGPHADVQAHASVPVIYLKLESVKIGTTEDSTSLKEVSDHFRLVRIQARKDRRIVGMIAVSMTGKAVPEEQKSVSITIDPVAEGWLKITPSDSLTPGEYGLVELMNGKGVMNSNLQKQYLPDNIWDFGVNPSAPANAMAAKPEVPIDQPPAPQPPSDAGKQQDGKQN